MRKIQLSPKEYFSFFAITEPSTTHAASAAHRLAQAFSAATAKHRYGEGVKNITVTLILTNPEGLGTNHKVQKPKYQPGLRSINAHGVTVLAEDTLEFGLRPALGELSAENCEQQLAAAIVSAIAAVRPQLAALKIRNFNMESFLSDLEQFLAQRYARKH